MSDNLSKLGLVPFFTGQLHDPDRMLHRLHRVISVQRSTSTVWGLGDEHVVGLSPSLQQSAAIDRPTVGDWVLLDESGSRIELVLQRKTLFKRIGAGSGTDIQPIAANIDVLFIVTSCNEEFKESRLERYLALCADAGAVPVIVLTKIDQTDDVEGFVDRARQVQAGVAVETANALDATTLEGVRAWISETSTVALVGSSGVGKSSLLNTLASQNITATGDIREQDKKGRHTTSHRQLHLLPAGGLLIDVPGMREIRVAEIDHALDSVFAEIEDIALHCQFADCHHEAEPGCAVHAAIANNELDERRLRNYQKLQRENSAASASLAEKRARGKGFAKVVKQVKRFKKQKQLF
ncbi:MAG: ribosome small subunit-dependent GTPase A [Pseudohongiellaceae bacterium]